MTRLKTGVLISGRGSNLKALIDACAAPDFPAEIVLVLSNVEGAGGLEHASRAQIPTATLSHKDFPNRAAFDEAMNAKLRAAGVEFVCLAGFMRLLSARFTKNWEGKMINIHPSLLPLFKGLHVHEQVLAAGATESGCTVHYVIPELDSGPAIVQARVPVEPGDTPDTLAARVLREEHRIYPQALRMVAEGKVRLENGRVILT